MDRLEKIENHLRKSPSDYQSVISYMKLRSERIDKQIKEEQNKRRKYLQKIRRSYEERTQ